MRAALLALTVADRAAGGAGAKLSGAAGLGAPAGAGHRRYASPAPRRPCSVSSAPPPNAPWQLSRRPGDGADRPQGRRLGACVSRLCAQGRAGEGGRRQARAGGLLQDRPQLRFCRVAPSGLPAHRRRHDLRRRPVLARLQHHHHARADRLEGAWREHVARAGISPAACWSTIRATARRGPAPASSSTCNCPGKPAPAAASRCRSRSSKPCRISRQAGAVLAILPRQALDRFKGCLPAEVAN